MTDLPPPVPAPPPPAAPAQAPVKEWPTERIGALIAAGVVIVGSIGPWLTVQSAFGSIDANGMDRDGQITIVGGIVIAVLVYLAKYLAAMIMAGLTTAVFVYDYYDVQQTLEEVNANEFVNASVAWGLYAVGIGAVAALALSATMRTRAKKSVVQFVPGNSPQG